MRLLFFLFSIFLNIFLLGVLLPLLRRLFLDRPNKRSSHLRPTPRGGGVAFVFFLVLVSAFDFVFLSSGPPGVNMVVLYALPLSIVGFLDDYYNLGASIRFGVQLLTSYLLLDVSPLVLIATDFLSASEPVICMVPLLTHALLVIALTAIINFINFMDGLDGLVAGSMVFVFASLMSVFNTSLILLALVGSLFGFLFWNWSPARVFMGDVGSTFLGAVFAGFVLQAPSWFDASGFLLVATPLLADAFFCLIRRFLAGQRIFDAHRLHLFQRLHQAGWSHTKVSLAYMFATFVLSVAMLTGGFIFVLVLSVAVVLLGVWLDQRFAVPFLVASGN